jgi:hypothetical protein
MTITTTAAEVFFLTLPEEVHFDTDHPASREALVASYRESFVPLPEAEQLDADVDDNVF